MKEYIFTWRICNISYSWHKINEKIVSPIFTVDPMHSSRWTLRLYPRGYRNSDYLSLLLRRETDSFPGELKVNFELSCISADTSVVQSCIFKENMHSFTKEPGNGFGELRFLKRYEVFGRRKALYLPEDTLSLRCRMRLDEFGDGFDESYRSTPIKLEQVKSSVPIKRSYLNYYIVDIKSLDQLVLISIEIKSHKDGFDIKTLPTDTGMKSATLNVCFEDTETKRQLCKHEIVWSDDPLEELFSLPFSGTDYDNCEENSFSFHYDLTYSTGGYAKNARNCKYPPVPEYISIYTSRCVPSGKNEDKLNLVKDIRNLYEKGILCDIKLKIKDTVLNAHKTVLCARSSTFLSMFTVDLQERENGCVEIEDISVATMKKFLIYLYTDDFTDLEWEEVANLYYAADKYQVGSLKRLCSSFLINNVCLDNNCTLFKLAHQHNDFELIRKVTDFISENERMVFSSSLWKEFANKESHLAGKYMLWKYGEKDNPSSTQAIDDSITNYPSMLEDLKSLYQGQIVNDIVLKTKSTNFPAHKTVLCALSATFKDILTRMSPTSKNIEQTDFIEIEDFEDDIISRLLLFLYNDCLDLEWDSAKNLYYAADMYQIQRLKYKCSLFLLENLKLSNACELLLLAHKHGDDKLKLAVEEFIHLYDEEIFRSDGWAALGESNARLAFEIMCAKYKK